MEQLGFTDSIFINLETASTPQHIAFLGIYDQSGAKDIVRFKDVLANFERRLHALPHFRTRLVQVPARFDRPYWIVDDEFDVEYHIRHLALPSPGDWRQLCIQVARLHSRSMDMNRTMWECYVIEGLDHVEGCAPGSFAVYLKVHHALVDGDLGQQIMTAIHDKEPYPPAPEYPDDEAASKEADAFKAPILGGSELVARAPGQSHAPPGSQYPKRGQTYPEARKHCSADGKERVASAKPGAEDPV